MIVNDQKNLKVHLAGLESVGHFEATRLGGFNYSLFTAYPFVASRMNNTNRKPVNTDLPGYIYDNSRHSIMDSGLFTLMFGAKKGKRDKAYLERWMHNLVEFTHDTGYKGSLVEVDCQKILGVDEAWEFRQKMQQMLPNNRVMNVWHLEDGLKGLDRMIEYSNYICLSIPELRLHKKMQYPLELASYIKNKKPDIDIHLLGCTDLKMLNQINFASSSDSTSWLYVVSSGQLVTEEKGTIKLPHIDRDKLIKEYQPILDPMFVKHGIEPSEKSYYNYGLLVLQCKILKRKYSVAAGNQD
jgi:hypothetical protein